jgi:hypothetical protein
MHAVTAGIVYLDRQECAGPDMERHSMERDVARPEAIDQSIGKMQAGGRRRD